MKYTFTYMYVIELFLIILMIILMMFINFPRQNVLVVHLEGKELVLVNTRLPSRVTKTALARSGHPAI